MGKRFLLANKLKQPRSEIITYCSSFLEISDSKITAARFVMIEDEFMLITFRSKAYPNILMYQNHAKRILEILHKDPNRGVITAEEATEAIKLLEQEIDESRRHKTTGEVQQDIKAHHTDQNDHDHELIDSVNFSARAYPLLEMLRSASNNGDHILWGV